MPKLQIVNDFCRRYGFPLVERELGWSEGVEPCPPARRWLAAQKGEKDENGFPITATDDYSDLNPHQIAERAAKILCPEGQTSPATFHDCRSAAATLKQSGWRGEQILNACRGLAMMREAQLLEVPPGKAMSLLWLARSVTNNNPVLLALDYFELATSGATRAALEERVRQMGRGIVRLDD